MLGLRAIKAMHAAYPELSKVWRENGVRAWKGLPPLPVPSLDPLRAKPESSTTVQRGGGPVGG